jgi:hypothetical protein
MSAFMCSDRVAPESDPADLTSPNFNAQRCAHRILRSVTRPSDPEVFAGVKAPCKARAHLALTTEADMSGVSLRHERVSLVRRWIEMSSGVRV